MKIPLLSVQYLSGARRYTDGFLGCVGQCVTFPFILFQWARRRFLWRLYRVRGRHGNAENCQEVRWPFQQSDGHGKASQRDPVLLYTASHLPSWHEDARLRRIRTKHRWLVRVRRRLDNARCCVVLVWGHIQDTQKTRQAPLSCHIPPHNVESVELWGDCQIVRHCCTPHWFDQGRLSQSPIRLNQDSVKFLISISDQATRTSF